MGIESLYTLSDLSVNEGHFSVLVSFDPRHRLFRGHFPGQPIVPGVILIRIIKEISEKITRQEVQLETGSNMKFLNIIDPEKTSCIIIKGSVQYPDNNHLSINAVVSYEDIQFFKFKGVFTIFVSKDK
jgi:3-hydroxyacyl-[acyl-carrier-protein] dehydratase